MHTRTVLRFLLENLGMANAAVCKLFANWFVTHTSLANKPHLQAFTHCTLINKWINICIFYIIYMYVCTLRLLPHLYFVSYADNISIRFSSAQFFFCLFGFFFLFIAKLCCILIHFLCAEATDVNKPSERRSRQLSRCSAQIVLSWTWPRTPS